MRDIRNGQRVVVHTDGSAGPYTVVSQGQAAAVVQELRSAKLAAAADYGGPLDNDPEADVTINISGDPAKAQSALDDAEFGKVRAGVMGLTLNIRVRNRQWSITIRRSDQKIDPLFARLHDKFVSEPDVRDFIPDVNELQWTDQDPQPNGKRQSQASAGDYLFTLEYPVTFPATQARAEFTESMANAPWW